MLCNIIYLYSERIRQEFLQFQGHSSGLGIYYKFLIASIQGMLKEIYFDFYEI